MRAIVVTLALLAGPAAGMQSPADCADWQTCRAMVEQALSDDDLERAHDLAWRAVQRGPRDDAALMFLLARAQSRAGRPQDALVMVRRLAERGVPTAALDHPDLGRMRTLPGWPAVEALVRRAGTRDEPPAVEPPAPAPAPSPAPVAPSAAVAPAAAVEPDSSREPAAALLPPPPPVAPPATSPMAVPAAAAPASPAPAAPPSSSAPSAAPRSAAGAGRIDRTVVVEDVWRFAVDPFVAAGVAYDGVSQRLVIGDRHGRKVRVVGERLDEAVDMVRADSAGFGDIHGLAIDTRRGDLWVVSAGPAGGGAAVHRLQLISGRPLQRLPIPVEPGASVRPVDLAVTPSGTVIVLEQAGRLWLASGSGTSVAPVATLDVTGATSVAPGRAADVVYVAHEGGILRVDPASGRTTPLEGPPDVRLAGFERLRAHRDGLVGLQADPDGSRRVVRLALRPGGRAVASATVFDARFAASEGPLGFAVSDDEVSIVSGLGDEPSDAGPGGHLPALSRVRRLRLP